MRQCLEKFSWTYLNDVQRSKATSSTNTKYDKSVGMDDVIDLKEETNILSNQNEPSKRLSLHSLSQVSKIKSSFTKHTLFPSIK